MHILPHYMEWTTQMEQHRRYYLMVAHLVDLIEGRVTESKTILGYEGILNNMARKIKEMVNNASRDDKQQRGNSQKPAKWLVADVRTREHQAALAEFANDTERVLDHMVELCEFGVDITLKRDNRGKPVCYLFFPDTGQSFKPAISANAPDGYLALACAIYKFVHVLNGRLDTDEHPTDEFQFG